MPEQTANAKHFFKMFAEFEYKLDSQRRVAVPAAWRAENESGRFTLIRGRDGILQLYPEQAFNELYSEKLMRLRTGSAEDMLLARNFCSNCIACVCDSQGRIQLPKELLEKVGITSRVAMIGCGNLIQILSGERRDAEVAKARAAGTEDDYISVMDL